jgi:inosine-uridine nucleoside N-ribohydrolase
MADRCSPLSAAAKVSVESRIPEIVMRMNVTTVVVMTIQKHSRRLEKSAKQEREKLNEINSYNAHLISDSYNAHLISKTEFTHTTVALIISSC